MADVAALAGVSTSTVSHVLNRTRAVDPRTRARVENAVRLTGYRPNHVARSLATSSSRTIGLAMSMLGRDNYFAEFAHAVETSARRAGYTLTYADTHDEADTEKLVLTQFLSQRIDGMIWASSGSPAVAVGPAVATVLVDRLRDEPHDQVGPENVEATATLTAHLAGHGHRRVALVAGMAGWNTTAERIAGFRRTVAERDLDPDPALIVHGDSQAEPARQAVHVLFALDNPPTALVSANNAMTFGVLRALRELGLSAPHDVALVCYDDFDWADLVTPGPTAMRQQIDAMGRRAVTMLVDRLKHPERPYLIERLPPVFRIRESCGCPPAEVPHPQQISVGRPARGRRPVR